MKLAVCDDDALICKSIMKLITKYFKTKGLSCPDIDAFNSGEEIVDSGNTYDIIFIDVEMDGISGIHAAHILKLKNPKTIFMIITNYGDYLDEALRFDAFRYMTKPINPTRFYNNLGDALHIISTKYVKIAVEVPDGIRVFYSSDIIMLERLSKEVIIHTASESLASKTAFEVYEERLKNACFYRTHRSFLVNFEHVQNFDKNIITLSEDKRAYLARKYYKGFKDAFLTYLDSTS